MPETDPLADAPRQAAGGLVLLSAALAALSGIALTFAYQPDAWRWLRTLHAGAAAVAVVSSIAARVVARGGRLKISRRAVGFVAVAVLVLGGAFATGSLLRWEGGAPGDHGVFLDAAQNYSVDGTDVSAGSIAVSAAIHTALGAAAFVLLGWDQLRAAWRARRGRA